jgi:hypothetical protein
MAGKLLITPNSGSTTAGQDPTIKFQGTSNSSDITLRVTSTGSLSFEGTTGQLFSVTDSMSGTIYSVNDISGIPSIEVLDTGLIKLAQYSGNVVLGSSTDDGVNKLQVTGPVSITGQLTSTLATGTAPLVIASTTLVPNLNADLHDGLQVATANTVSTVVARDASGNFAAGTITATLSGTATSVTTNANLTGPITSTGNATAIASQTGTGTKFVMDTSPVLVTPNIGVATGTSFNSITGLSATSPAMDGTATVGTGVTVARADHIHPSDTSKLSLSGGTMTGSIVIPTGQDITLTDQPVVGTDAANKNYVDAVAAGLSWKNSVKAATTTYITLSGTQTVDAVVLVAEDRVLVKNQTLPYQNGIYVVKAGAWVRSADMDATTPLNEFNGAGTLVTGGTTYDNTAWTVTSTVNVVDNSDVTWAQFNGAAGITAGTGLTLTGNTISVNASQTQITAVGTLGSLTVSGTITGSNLSGTNTGDQTLPTTLPNPNAVTFNNSGTGSASGTTYTGSAAPTISYNTIGAQPLDADLTAIAAIADGSTGLLKKTAANTWSLDTTAYSTTSGTVTSVAALTLGTTGTDVSSSVATGTTTPVITLNIPTASSSNRGLLSAADWTTFNGKQAAGSYQSLDADLTAIAGLVGTSGFLKKTAADTWSLDTTAYTANLGTVTSVSVTTANGVSGTVATNTTTPAITLTLGAITPSSISTAGQITSTVTTGTAPLVVASTTVVTNLNADLLDGLQSSAFATSGHNHTGVYLTAEADTLDSVTGRGASTANAITLSAAVPLILSNATSNTITTGTDSNLFITSRNSSAASTGNVSVYTGDSTFAGGSAGAIAIRPGQGSTTTAVGAGLSLQGGTTNAPTSVGGHLSLWGGSSYTNATTSGTGGNAFIFGGRTYNATGSKQGGHIYIDGGNDASTPASYAATAGSVNIGTNGSGYYGTGTSAINIGSTSATTTVNGTVKLPNVGTSGFVKLGAGGQLSNDTTTYVTSIGVTTGSGISATSSGGATPSLTFTLGALTGTSFNSITGLASVAPVMNGTQTLGVSTLAARQDHVHASDTSKLSLSGGTMTGSITIPTGQDITLTDLPVAGTDAVNKNYVDAAITGLTWKNSAAAATTTNINLTTGGLLVIDGYQTVAADRILVKNQTAGAENGIYDVNAGAWTRSADANTGTELDHATIFVEHGTAQAGSGWTVSNLTTPTLGTTAITFAQFTGGASITAGSGLTLTGNSLSVNASQTGITTVGTLGSLAVTGAISGSALTSTVTTGTAPLVVTSTTMVANLNADLLDGNQASAFALSSHTHGNISNTGAIGTTANLPIITTTSGVLVTGTFGTGVGTFCAGDDSRLATQTAVSGQAGYVASSLTFNSSGTGAASGTTFNGSAAQTISYNTIGAQAAGSYAAAGATTYVGTTAIALNRTSAAQALTGITSIDGYASILNTAGNYQVSRLGVGVAPTTAWSFTGSIDVGPGAAFTGNGSVFSAMMAANVYYNGTNWIYKNNGFTGRVVANSGGTGDIDFYTAPSGTAAGVATEVNVLKVTATGNVAIASSGTSGGQSGTAQLQVGKYGASGVTLAEISIDADATTGVSQLTFGGGGSAGYPRAYINYNHSTDTLTFHPRTSAVEISRDGNIGMAGAAATTRAFNDTGSSIIVSDRVTALYGEGGAGTPVTYLSTNAYYSNVFGVGTSWQGQGTGSASAIYGQGLGTHTWSSAGGTGTLTLLQQMALDAPGNLTVAGAISGSNLSGTNTGDNAANSNYASDYRAANFVAGTNYVAPSAVTYVGTTSIAHNRASAAQSLTGITSIDGYAGSTVAAVTFNNAGTGAASGTTFNGSAAQTISYNTIGAAASGHNHTGVYQPLGADLTAIDSLAGTSGFLKKTAADTWSLDTSAYVTASVILTTAAQTNITSVGTLTNLQTTSLGVGTAASGTAGEIRATNNITAYYSDDRLKTRTGNIENALDKISTLDTFYYHANETAQALGYEPVDEVGISAQQVQAIMPQVVAPAPIDDKYLTVRYERLVPLLIASIKELKAEIEALKAGK